MTTPDSGTVTLAIRPERTGLATDDQSGDVLENAAYAGTDTVYYLSVTGQLSFHVCQQDRDDARCPRSPGAKVRVWVSAIVVRVLVE